MCEPTKIWDYVVHVCLGMKLFFITFLDIQESFIYSLILALAMVRNKY